MWKYRQEKSRRFGSILSFSMCNVKASFIQLFSNVVILNAWASIQ